MSKFQIIDTNLFAALILIVLLLSITLRKNRFSISTRLFSLVLWVNLIILFLESLSWLIDGSHSPEWRWLHYLINYFYLLSCSLPAVTWLSYLDYQIFGSLTRLKKRFYYIFPLILVALILLFSIKSGFIFTIDQSNSYQRGPGNFILYGISYFVLVYALIMTLNNMKNVEKRLMGVVLVFTLVPAIAALIQFLFYGTVILWASMVLTLLIIYLFLEIQQVTRDYLTGLYNRRQIDEWIHFRMRKYEKQGSFTLVMIDLDDFKNINDTFGHKEGDNTLIAFSDILMKATKRKDMIARFAGDEFLLVLETASPTESEAIIARIIDLISLYNDKETNSYNISFSSGLAVYDPNVHSKYRDLLHHADVEMYKNKRKKKNL